MLERLARRGVPFGDEGAARVRALMPDLKERAKTLEELAGAAAFAARGGAAGDGGQGRRAADPGGAGALADLARFLSDAPWERLELERWLRDYAEVKGVKLGQVAQPLRAALTGSTQSPPIDAVLAALGRTEAMDRVLAAVGDLEV